MAALLPVHRQLLFIGSFVEHQDGDQTIIDALRICFDGWMQSDLQDMLDAARSDPPDPA